MSNIIDFKPELMSSGHWTFINKNTNANAGQRLLVDTSNAAVNITLPNNSKIGDSVELLDANGTWSINNAIISAGTNIQGLPSPLNLTISSKYIVLVFNGT